VIESAEIITGNHDIMTPASRECVLNLLNENIEVKATATNEDENVCDAHPNLPIEMLYHAVYIPLEYRDLSEGEGN